jgi:fatty acid desaturase
LVYLVEPLHWLYTHTNHHTDTWHIDKDSQIPFETPATLRVWLIEMSGAVSLNGDSKSDINRN